MQHSEKSETVFVCILIIVLQFLCYCSASPAQVVVSHEVLCFTEVSVYQIIWNHLHGVSASHPPSR